MIADSAVTPHHNPSKFASPRKAQLSKETDYLRRTRQNLNFNQRITANAWEVYMNRALLVGINAYPGNEPVFVLWR